MYIHKGVILIFFLVEVYCQKFQQQKIESYQSCQRDVDCKPNSFCYGNDDTSKGKCKCLEGFELYRNTTFYECFQASKLGDPCEYDLQCTIVADLAECNQYKICTCKSLAQPYTDGKCYLSQKLGEICRVDANCYLGNNTYGFCTYGHCECPIDQRPSEDNLRCIATRALGEYCNTDDECGSTPNARCFDVCHCGIGYTLSRDQKECVKAATKFGENCTFDGQCSKYLSQSICVNGQCGCNDGQHGYNNKCVFTRRPEERCQEHAQCIYETTLERNVECKNGVCRCIYGMSGGGVCDIEVVDNSAGTRLIVTLVPLLVTKFGFLML